MYVTYDILDIESLMYYREFDRVAIPAPKVFAIETHTVDEVAVWILKNGIAPVELSIFEDKALLTDGNHRTAAANKLGIKSLSTKIIHYESTEELENALFLHSINRFKKILNKHEPLMQGLRISH